VLAARASDGSGFRIDAVPAAASLRVVVVDAARCEHASPWATLSATPSLAFVVDDGVTLVGDGTQPPLAAALASPQTRWRVRSADGVAAPAR
jgi:hypothetical protein